MAEKVPMIALSPTMDLGTVVKWLKKEGDPVKSGDVICQVETDKAVMDYESSSEGTLLKILVPEGGQARVGDAIAVLGAPGEDPGGALGASRDSRTAAGASAPAAFGAAVVETAPVPTAAMTPAQASVSAPPGRIRSSPLARRLAEERRIDLHSIAGSGPGGRIVKRDLEAFGTDRILLLSGMRRTIAARMSQSMSSAPHFYLTVPIVMDALLSARRELNGGRERKLSLNAFLIKLAAEALKRHPRINSSWNGDSIVFRERADIGLAVALEDGLVTPVVRDCGAKGIEAIDGELADLVERARGLRLRPEEYTDAGFTISNLGAFGIEEFTAVINPPGSAILAVGAIVREPVAGPEDAVVIKSRMRATLSCDHRVIDGAVGAAFLDSLRAMIENPYRTLL